MCATPRAINLEECLVWARLEAGISDSKYIDFLIKSCNSNGYLAISGLVLGKIPDSTPISLETAKIFTTSYTDFLLDKLYLDITKPGIFEDKDLIKHTQKLRLALAQVYPFTSLEVAEYYEGLINTFWLPQNMMETEKYKPERDLALNILKSAEFDRYTNLGKLNQLNIFYKNGLIDLQEYTELRALLTPLAKEEYLSCCLNNPSLHALQVIETFSCYFDYGALTFEDVSGTLEVILLESKR